MRRQTRRAMETAGSAEIVARFPQPLGKRCAFPTVPTAPTTTSPNQVSAEPGQDQNDPCRPSVLPCESSSMPSTACFATTSLLTPPGSLLYPYPNPHKPPSPARRRLST